MATSRRAVLASLPAAALVPFAVARPGWGMPDPVPAFVTTCRDPSGHAAAVLDASARTMFTVRFPGRGHGTAIAPDARKAVVFSRRPGRFALVLDLERGTAVERFSTSPGRHFCGHGFFSPDGRLVYATENDYGSERGVLGVYDARGGCRRIGELDTHGIGPHEAVLMRDGRTVAVANGGIATHPDYPRRKLNLHSMQPSLVYLDLATGELLERAVSPPRLRSLSIRHIAEAESQTVWFGGQYEGPRTDPVDLVGCHRRGEDLAFLPAPRTVHEAMKGYVGSVAASRDGTRVAVTSPRGGVLTIWNARSREVVGTRRIADVSGVAPGIRGFVASDGKGRIWREGEVISRDDVQWDNHLAAAVQADRAASAA